MKAATTPVGVIHWATPDAEWRARRREGLGGSDIATILGFSTFRTPWLLWATYTGLVVDVDEPSAAAELGTALEPWIRTHAEQMLGETIEIPEWRTFAHAAHPWRRCSPDGVLAGRPGWLFEAKTAGLASGFGTPRGWDGDDGIPLAYELQCRWSMHVMDASGVELVALVAGRGMVHRTILRDLAVEAELVRQVTDWHRTHLVDGVEPPVTGADNAVLARLFPVAVGDMVALDGTDAAEHWQAYRRAHKAEKAAKTEKAEAAAALKRLIGDHKTGLVDGSPIASWSAYRGDVDYPRLLDDLAAAGVEIPDPETYRKPATRRLSVKEPK